VSATASADSFIAYMKTLIASSSETAAPISLGTSVAPTSDTAQPTGL
jgi:hypothetical protein